jgi:neutral ceramidase
VLHAIDWTGVAGVIAAAERPGASIGVVAVVALPVELFTAFGRRIKAESPFPDTVLATMANGLTDYVRTVEAFARDGYEPLLAYQSRLIPEAVDLMTTAALDLLRQLAGSR